MKYIIINDSNRKNDTKLKNITILQEVNKIARNFIHFFNWRGGHRYLLLECFIVLWWPIVILGLGAEFAFLVSQMWTHGIDFYKWPEHGVGLPDEVVHSDHWETQRK